LIKEALFKPGSPQNDPFRLNFFEYLLDRPGVLFLPVIKRDNGVKPESDRTSRIILMERIPILWAFREAEYIFEKVALETSCYYSANNRIAVV
jgi:hypothetical protein